METPDHGNDALAPVGHISQPACHAQADLGAAIDVQRTAAFHVHHLGLSRCRRTGLPAGAHIARPPCSQVGGRWTASLPATLAMPGEPGSCRAGSQLTACSTSAAILASAAAVSSVSAKATGHRAPSSRCAASLKPSVAYLVLNFCAGWKKQAILPSLA